MRALAVKNYSLLKIDNMKTVTAVYPWGVHPKHFEFNVYVDSVLPGGYGHKEVTFKVNHPYHKFEPSKIIKVTSNNMPLFDSLQEVGYDQKHIALIEHFVESDKNLLLEISEWIEEVNAKHVEESETE